MNRFNNQDVTVLCTDGGHYAEIEQDGQRRFVKIAEIEGAIDAPVDPHFWHTTRYGQADPPHTGCCP